METFSKKIGAKIRDYRLLKKLSSKNFAGKLGMSVSGLAKIERGETDMSISRIEQIATLLEVSFKDILFDKEGNHFDNQHGVTNATLIGTNNGTLNLQENERIAKIEQDIKLLTVMVLNHVEANQAKV